MYLKDLNSGEHVSAVIERMTKKDFGLVKQSRARFVHFEWQRYKDEEVYKLRLKADTKILGLMCILDHVDDGLDAVEIRLLEVCDEHTGAKKRLENISGCLIAFACRVSFNLGHDGYVFLLPKSELVAHYRSKYGFQHIPGKRAESPMGYMLLDERNAMRLIFKYLN
jgi:hypothetical protein